MPRVYAYVAYRIGGGPDAEDITSEVFERAVRYRASYRADHGSPITWLTAIARRIVAEPGRPTTASLPDERADGDDIAAEVVERLTLVEAVAALSERDRELIALRFGSDLSSGDIGALLGCTPNAADVALHRALRRLREILEGADSQEPSVVQRA